MRRMLGAIMCLILLAAAALPAAAQTSRGRYAGGAAQYGRYDNSRRVYYDRRNRERSFWDRHRDKVTVAAGTGVGALIGGAAGGKKGALIGGLLGAGGSVLYTYQLRDRDQRRYDRRR